MTLVDRLEITLTFERASGRAGWSAKAVAMPFTIAASEPFVGLDSGATQEVAGQRAIRNLLHKIARGYRELERLEKP